MLNVEAQEGPHAMESLLAGRSRIEVESTPAGILLDQQQMTVAANEEPRPVRVESTPNATGVAPWTPSDVGHPDGEAFALDVMVLREFTADQLVVYVAMDGEEGGNLGEGVGHGQAANVAGMPDFVAFLQMVEDAVVHVSVGVAEESNPHGCKLATDVRLAPSWRFGWERWTNR